MKQKNKLWAIGIFLIIVLIIFLIPGLRYSIFGGGGPTQEETQIMAQAIETNNFSLCEKIPKYSRVDPGAWSYDPCYYLRNKCYIEIVEKTENFSLCDRMFEDSCDYFASPYYCYRNLYRKNFDEIKSGKTSILKLCEEYSKNKEGCIKYIQFWLE